MKREIKIWSIYPENEQHFQVDEELLVNVRSSIRKKLAYNSVLW